MHRTTRIAITTAGLVVTLTLLYSWLGTSWKYENIKTETTVSPQICSAICGTNPRGMEGMPNPRFDPRTEAIARFFDTYNPSISYIAPYVVVFSDFYQTDPYLVVAIGSQEQDYFRSCYYFNCYGHFVNGEYIRYGSLVEGVEKATRLLGEHYGGQTIAQIGPVYCPTKGGCDTAHWIQSVTTIYNQIKEYGRG